MEQELVIPFYLYMTRYYRPQTLEGRGNGSVFSTLELEI